MRVVHSEYTFELLHEIRSFKIWAIDHGPYGDWESEYDHWDDIWEATKTVIKRLPAEEWSPKVTTSFLYILARDHKEGYIISELINKPDQLLHIAYRALTFPAYPDYEARWQIAYGLGKMREYKEQAQNLLHQLAINDPHEYVRRRAIMSYDKKKVSSIT
ncbi:hypothetical protein N780_09925 [Pontibacillus chungwhensis BH030062]|uniref:HEAT repeat domain-containing protein n=1 Tax=Pontibacillus chungwhensis BH030062 TaxID=1385513 RepID=A0A0A2UPD6_9BACI|nr:HEAT repeat domain-containing protein [Pontibacillus chungwhensis]KGP89799.1 hypothetical protein N780_09925 [Pontibacillus chungwhensis BH030062]